MGIPGHLLDGGTSAGAGGVLGLVGNVATRTIGYLESKHAFFQKQAEWAHETELLQLQSQWPQPETEFEPALVLTFMGTPPVYGGSTAEGGEGGGSFCPLYPASHRLPPPRCGEGTKWVEAVRALVRPVLTLGLSAVLAAAFFSMASGDTARAAVADTLIFVTTTAIVWWFGDRAPSRKR